MAARVKDRFDNLSNEFDETEPLVGGRASSVEIACGEFSDDVVDGCDTMRLGYRSVFEICSKTAGLIAGNTNALHVDLTKVDQDFSWHFDLTGNEVYVPRGKGPI